ncbi:hypothetical protein [Aliamphritea ceti]|uniref:hypothetical protein n=1 Tax=Aliamphritea ceti TaxID=1524258 RepID=UPI0021C47064|nr:hypothetical protein [Aliamphritea ceti]
MIIRRAAVWLGVLGSMATLSLASHAAGQLNEAITYVITQPAGYLDSSPEPATLYDLKPRGFVDGESMFEVRPAMIQEKQLPPPTVIPFDRFDPVQVVIGEQEIVPTHSAEDKIFLQIAIDQVEIDCLLGEIEGDDCAAFDVIEEEPAGPDSQPKSRRVIDRQFQALQ